MALMAPGLLLLQGAHERRRRRMARFLPALAYFRPALPRRPVDRGATDDALTHFLPTAFDRGAAALIAAPAEGARPVLCSEALIESTVVESKHGTLVPLVNWAGRPIRDLTVTVNVAAPAGRAELASSGEVRVRRAAGRQTFTLDLDVADALILR